MPKQTVKYLTLKEAAKITPYQQEYLSLLCRRKQIKAIKINHKWHTTEKWLNAYLKVYKTDELIEEPNTNITKKIYYPLALTVTLVLVLLATSLALFQNRQVHVAEESFTPNQRTIIFDENGNRIIQETGTRVLGTDTEKQ
jgi:hypothetical protein